MFEFPRPHSLTSGSGKSCLLYRVFNSFTCFNSFLLSIFSLYSYCDSTVTFYSKSVKTNLQVNDRAGQKLHDEWDAKESKIKSYLFTCASIEAPARPINVSTSISYFLHKLFDSIIALDHDQEIFLLGRKSCGCFFSCSYLQSLS